MRLQGEIRSALLTLRSLAEQLNLSPSYLSDLLKQLTGLNAPQHIHNRIIDKAKDLLTTSNWSIREIAFRLSFEHPQSFSKLFQKNGLFALRFQKSVQLIEKALTEVPGEGFGQRTS